MTRGKHSAASAIRRAEGAHEVIDRLTTQMVDLKERTRLAEREAARVPSLILQVQELTTAASRCPGLLSTVERLEEQVATAEWMADVIADVVARLLAAMPEEATLSELDWRLLDDCFGLDRLHPGEFATNRSQRRNLRFGHLRQIMELRHQAEQDLVGRRSIIKRHHERAGESA